MLKNARVGRLMGVDVQSNLQPSAKNVEVELLIIVGTQINPQPYINLHGVKSTYIVYK